MSWVCQTDFTNCTAHKLTYMGPGIASIFTSTVVMGCGSPRRFMGIAHKLTWVPGIASIFPSTVVMGCGSPRRFMGIYGIMGVAGDEIHTESQFPHAYAHAG